MGPLAKCLHASTFLAFLYGIYYDNYKLQSPPNSHHRYLVFDVIGGRWKFLTYINLVLQCAFFGLCVLNDLIGSETVQANRRSVLQKLRDFMLATLVVPLGLFIPLIFWGLCAVDRRLVSAESMDGWFPAWLNHIMHSLPFITALLEVVIVNHVYPRGKVLYFPIIVTAALYLSWVCFIAYHSDVWVYPVLKVLDLKSRAAFMACLVPPLLLLVFLGQKLHTAVWGSGSGSARRGKKNKSQ